MQCAKCGYVLSPFDRACPKCGQAVGAPQTEGAPAAAYRFQPEVPGVRPSRFPWTLEGRYEPVGRVVGFWSRVAASMLDSALLFLVGGVIAVPLILFGVGAVGAAPEEAVPGLLMTLYVIWALLTMAAQAAYGTVLIGLRGQTLGMGWVGLSVIRQSEEPIGYGLALARWAVYALPAMVPYVGGIWGLLNPLWVSWDMKKQALHDMACGTLVVASGPRNAFAHGLGLVLLFLPLVVIPALVIMAVWIYMGFAASAMTPPVPPAVPQGF